MDDEDLATQEGPARRRASWSLKTIVENVAGVPISELQDPGRPVHPYLQAKLAAGAPALPSGPPSDPELFDTIGPAEGEETELDPIQRVYPPLIGPTGRALHGKEREHHRETIERVAGEPRPRLRPPGPSRRPERIYLHYLLLHLDRLNDAALRYLQHAVEEEILHRESTEPKMRR